MIGWATLPHRPRLQDVKKTTLLALKFIICGQEGLELSAGFHTGG